jgi:hypothetical protein
VLLLADLAEAACGSVLQTSGQTEILKLLPPDQVRATREKIAAKFGRQSSGLTPVERLLKWSVSDPRRRTISPGRDGCHGRSRHLQSKRLVRNRRHLQHDGSGQRCGSPVILVRRGSGVCRTDQLSILGLCREQISSARPDHAMAAHSWWRSSFGRCKRSDHPRAGHAPID